MKNKQIPAEIILDDILKSIKYYITEKKDRRTTLKSFFRKYKYFLFKNQTLFFSTVPFESSANYGFKWTIDCLYIDISFRYENGRPFQCFRTISTYRRIFPYLKFKKSGDSVWCSQSHTSVDLLNSFPTRENIINKLLAEL